jgi:hypothetical protein
MADHLAEQWRLLCPDRKVVGVCGDYHSRLAPTATPVGLWPAFAACFQQRYPQYRIRTVHLVFHGGSYHMNGRVSPFPVDPLPEAELRMEPSFGHSDSLHLPWATPATFFGPPAE